MLSGYEIGWDSDVSYLVKEGEKLAYFENFKDTGDNAAKKRIACFNGSATEWWTRSKYTNGSNAAFAVTSTGSSTVKGTTNQYGIRPAMILPPDLIISDDGSVLTNTAPTAPASITIPESIQGGTSIPVSWSAATDEDGNLEGYVVERSTDGGGSWTQIYQGSATQTTNTVPAGSETVMYRVKAYDAEGLYSTYRNSAQVSVFNNTAPNPPASISIPNEVLGGGALTVEWDEASDPDGNLAGYELERQADGGDWVQVYKGANTSYTDAITRGWASVNYRVRSYDAYDAVSGYAVGTARAVNNNRAPVITCGMDSGSDLGTKTEGFTVAYGASDADGDAVTVTEAIDGAELRTFLLDGVSAAMDVTGDTFFKVLNGAHTLDITASDGKAEAVHRLTFTKEVTSASITLAQPIEADDRITICVLSVAGSIPADAQYSVKATNNGKDDEPVWEDCTMEVRNGANHIFANETAADGFAFNFKVEVARGPSGQGGYIKSVQGGFQ